MGFGLVRWVVMSGVTLFLLPSFALPADKDIPESLLPSLERVWKMQDREMEKLQGQLREASASNSPNRRAAMAKIKKQITYIRNGGVPLIELKAWELKPGDVGQLDMEDLQIEVKEVVDDKTIVVIPIQRTVRGQVSEIIKGVAVTPYSEKIKRYAPIILCGWPADRIKSSTDLKKLGWFEVVNTKNKGQVMLVPLDTKSLAPHLKKRPKTTT